MDKPNPRFGNMLLEQFGGANGDLAAAMQYFVKSINCDDLEQKDLLMDIGTEQLSHFEMEGTLLRMPLKPLRTDREAAHADPLLSILWAMPGRRTISKSPVSEMDDAASLLQATEDEESEADKDLKKVAASIYQLVEPLADAEDNAQPERVGV